MKEIASFTVDHLKLLPWVYVSRKDEIGNEIVTTFDIRMTRPNFEPIMNTAELHSLEHLAATYFRNHSEFGNKIVYFWPMWCRTGCYLLLKWDFESKDIVPLLIELYTFMKDFKEAVPWATAKGCGCYLDHNLPMANYLSKKFLEEVLLNIKDENLNYPA
jgi:S-ribosylhomocysteine lyase